MPLMSFLATVKFVNITFFFFFLGTKVHLSMKTIFSNKLFVSDESKLRLD